MQLAVFLVCVAAVVGREGLHVDVGGYGEVSFAEHYDPSAALRGVLEVFAEGIDADEGLGGPAGSEKGTGVTEGVEGEVLGTWFVSVSCFLFLH